MDYSPKAGIAPLAVNFSVNASDPGIRVTWDFGDGTTGSGTRAEHVYAGPGEYSAEARWTVPGGTSGNRSGLRVAVYDPQNLPGNYSVGNLSPADMRYLSTLKKKVDLFDQYHIEFTYLNKSHATAMRYTSRDFQFAMKQSLSQLDTIETSPELGQVRESARVLFTNATDGAYAEFLAGINLEQGNDGGGGRPAGPGVAEDGGRESGAGPARPDARSGPVRECIQFIFFHDLPGISWNVP